MAIIFLGWKFGNLDDETSNIQKFLLESDIACFATRLYDGDLSYYFQNKNSSYREGTLIQQKDVQCKLIVEKEHILDKTQKMIK